MINTRLKLLAAGGVLLVLLAAIFMWFAYQVLHKQQLYDDALEILQTSAVDLNIMTTDLLYDAHTRIQPGQWQIIYNNLGEIITNSPLKDQAAYPFLKKQHKKIGQRFHTFLKTHDDCRQNLTRFKSPDSCKKLLSRLRTQIRLAQQDLLVEIHKIHERLIAQAQQQNFIGGLILLSLPALMSIFIIVLVLPITRSLGAGLKNMLEASERFSQGDFGFRLKNTTQDEMGVLANTYNKMAQRREEAEQQLQETEKILRQAQKMDAIGQLTGGIAHDFNNLLSIILGNLELLQRHYVADEKSKKYIAAIHKSSQRAADLTRQLLSFSRRQSAQIKATKISDVINDMEDLIARSITPQVEVVTDYADDLWLTDIDPGDFQDALLNLIINARDAMSGRGRLTLEASNCLLDSGYCSLNPNVKEGEYIKLSVSDNGTGIARDQQEHIFEPFFTTKPPGKSTGLGLAMVFGFTSRSHGHIKVYSELGIGTTFHIYLPRSKSQAGDITRLQKSIGELPEGNETLLIVDDETDLLALAEESLSVQGYRVITAVDGQQALQKLLEIPDISLLFSDVVMPGGLNGYELAEQACDHYPEIKVLLTSGYTEKAIARNGQARFNANMLNKPYSQAELIRKIRILLDTTAD